MPVLTSFPIVGIGASAGGLEAFLDLFHILPANTGMAYVLVQHLSPTHTSALTSLIQKTTQMKAQDIVDGVRVQPNEIYVIPPNKVLEIFHGTLHLRPIPIEPNKNYPINAFLSSLATDQGNFAIGVILSGTGSDGAQGLREIKSEGGVTFVQDPKSAKYDGMPTSAIAEAVPDFVLPVNDLARQLVTIASQPFVKNKISATEDSTPSPETELTLNRIFVLLRGTTKIDFSNYKYPTIIRRINRRMVLHRITSLKHYLDYLQASPAEVALLFEDLLINVTDFFRDPESFEALKTEAYQTILKDRPLGQPIRIWVPGCSTGEEVFSIAISLIEYLGENIAKYPIQIYGTDISASAIKFARAGFYSESSVKNLSNERLQKFFIQEQGGFRINRFVRDSCIFSIQDVTTQPPINRLDLLSCRNLMIYLGQTAQAKLMETFFYAINPSGFLMLGSTEGIGSAVNLFSVVDKKNKIYFKKTSNSVPSRELIAPAHHAHRLPTPGITEVISRHVIKPFDPVSFAERLVLDRFAPAWVLVNGAFDVIQFRGDTDKFVALAPGQPSWNLMKMLRDGLAIQIRVLIQSAIKENKPQRQEKLSVTSGGLKRIIDVEALPVSRDGVEPHCLVIFLDRSVAPVTVDLAISANKIGEAADPKNAEISRLRHELELSQISLKTIIDDLNSTNEEMQTANEEISSANEELQSTVEELETAKEELQSTNEELTTLNDELSARNNDLDTMSNDLINVLSNANVSIIMLSSDLRIRRFTPMAERRLKLIAGDIGRNLMDINLGFAIDNFDGKILNVIKTATSLELETRDREGHWYSLQIRPYRTADNRIEGAVIVFFNIDDIKVREAQVLAAENYSYGIIQTVRDPFIVLEQDFRVERANQAYYDTFEVSPESTVGRSFYELGNGQWNIPELRTLLEEVLPKKNEIHDFKVKHRFENIGEKEIVLNARSLEWEGQKKLLLLISLHEIRKA